MSERKVRMGIDVGGTHTKAVAIDNATHEIIGKSSVKTTHDDKAGVATGVVQAFKNCLKENDIDPKDVIFVAHSTTQATNALIEGDVAQVGVIGIGGKGPGGWIAKAQTNLKDIDLGSGRSIHLHNRYLVDDTLSDASVKAAIQELTGEGAQVIVASEVYGVDDMENENGVCGIAKQMGLEATAASEITKLYGLTRRTRTAVINASILPKMLNTANETEESVRSAGVEVPLMIMRGDGGVMEISEMKKRPVLTMLSGPAASVMGSLMYLRASNGVYFEVGGTTTNIGVIKDGRPAIDYSIVGGSSHLHQQPGCPRSGRGGRFDGACRPRAALRMSVRARRTLPVWTTPSLPRRKKLLTRRSSSSPRRRATPTTMSPSSWQEASASPSPIPVPRMCWG